MAGILGPHSQDVANCIHCTWLCDAWCVVCMTEQAAVHALHHLRRFCARCQNADISVIKDVLACLNIVWATALAAWCVDAVMGVHEGMMAHVCVCAGLAMDTRVYNCAMDACNLPSNQTLPVSLQRCFCHACVTGSLSCYVWHCLNRCSYDDTSHSNLMHMLCTVCTSAYAK